MQTSQNDLQLQIEQRIRTMRTLWGALVLSIGLYYVFTLFAEQPTINPNSALSLTLVAVGVLMIPCFRCDQKEILDSVR